MRILHTSDLHLGKVLHNTSLLDIQAQALEQIIELLRDRDIDGLIIAGDLYDRSIPSEDAVTLLNSFLDEVCRGMGIPTFIIAGNHDSGERLGFAASLLSSNGLHMAGPIKESVDPFQLEKDGDIVDVFLIPFANPRTVAHKFGLDTISHESALRALISQANANRTEGRPAVIVAHCFVSGGESSDSERTLSVGGSEEVPASLFAGFEYTALGHLHAPQNRGNRIRYSGSLLKYSFSEANHNKGVSIVDIAPDGQIDVEHVAIQPARDLREIEGEFDQLMSDGVTDPHANDFLRIFLTDEQSIPNAMARLQTVYPNALELIDVVVRDSAAGASKQIAAIEQQTPLEAFTEFYERVYERPLEEESRSYMASIIEEAMIEDQL
jgi:DNA repair protein SbcD/Mre11